MSEEVKGLLNKPKCLLDEYLTEDEEAEELKKTVRTLRRWRGLHAQRQGCPLQARLEPRMARGREAANAARSCRAYVQAVRGDRLEKGPREGRAGRRSWVS
jgi:hypothetical protein